MLSSISGRHFAGHSQQLVTPVPTGVGLFYSLPNNSYPGTGSTLYDLSGNGYNFPVTGTVYYNSTQPKSMGNGNYLNTMWGMAMPPGALLIANNTTTNFDWWFHSPPGNWQAYPWMMFSYKDVTTGDGVEIKLGGLNRLHLNSVTQSNSVEQTGPAYAIPINAWKLMTLVVDRPYNDMVLYVNGVEAMRRRLIEPYRLTQMYLIIDMVHGWNGSFADFQISYGPGGNSGATKFAAEKAYYGIV